MQALPPEQTRTRLSSTVLLAGLSAFCIYFCMYAFRKPFTVAQYEGLLLWGIDFKIILIISQVTGFAISKFFGIRFISGMQTTHRAWYLIGCIAVAGLALLGFALTPYPWNAFFMLLNGLPLGLIWGLVFSYLEGRQATEVMAAVLSASFILASGVVKTAGQWIMLSFDVNEFWMPVITGALFFLPLLLFVWLLQRTPPPTSEDIAARSVREPMTGEDRRKLFAQFAPGLIVFVLLYMVVTAFRDLRDNFSVEVWEELGVVRNAAVFTQSELPVAFGVLGLFAMFFFIRDNNKAFRGMQILICAGLAGIGIINLLFQQGVIQSPMLWTILTGAFLYTAYFPYNSMLFERLMAAFRCKGNAGFLIYVADAFGYLASILVLLYKEFFSADISYLNFFLQVGYILSVVGVVAMVFTHTYFRRKSSRHSVMASYQTSTT